MKRNQKETTQTQKAQGKVMRKPSKQQPQQKKWSGWRAFIDRYCAL